MMANDAALVDWSFAGIVCPTCGNAGIEDGRWLLNDGVPFRIVENLERSWAFRPQRIGSRVIATIDSAHDRIRWEAGSDRRLECEQCLDQFPIPSSLEIDFQ